MELAKLETIYWYKDIYILRPKKKSKLSKKDVALMLGIIPMLYQL